MGHGRLGGSYSSGVASSSLLDVGNLAAAAPAAGVEAGALFVYTLPGPVDLHAHDSTLVPFAQQRVDATAIAWIDSPGSPARSAVRFVNSTSQTLPAGTIAFFADGGFAGESSLARVKPGERRFITYGQDLDVELRSVDSRATEEAKRLVWEKAARRLEEHYLRTSDFTYAIENRSGRPRSVMLAMSLDHNATLTGPDSVDFDAAGSRPLAVFAVEPRKSIERKAHAVEGLVRTTAFASLTATRLTEIAASGSLDAPDSRDRGRRAPPRGRGRHEGRGTGQGGDRGGREGPGATPRAHEGALGRAPRRWRQSVRRPRARRRGQAHRTAQEARRPRGRRQGQERGRANGARQARTATGVTHLG